MDRFVHSDNIMLNRRDLFDYLQRMIHSNLSKHLSGIYKKEPYKIISAGLGGGLMSSDEFEVSSSGSNIKVNPGVGTGTDNSLIYNGDVVEIALNSNSSGIYHVSVKHRIIRSLTGKEVMLPPKGQINTDTLHTLIMDSCEVVVSGSGDTPNSIPLAKVYMKNGIVPTQTNVGTLGSELYVGDVGVVMPIAGVSPVDWSNEDNSNHLCVRIGEEYIIVNKADHLIVERGAYSTAKEHHPKGSVIQSLPIVDLRHQSLIGMSADTPNMNYLERGMVKVGNQVRSIVTREVKAPMPAPDVSISTDPIIWVNRNNAMSVITPDMQDAYNSLAVSQVNIDNMQAALDDVSYRLIGAPEDKEVQLRGEQKKLSADLVELRNERHAKLAALGNKQAIQAIQDISNRFDLLVDVSATGGEKPAQYEAEVIRVPISGVARVVSGSPEYYYSRRAYPSGFSVYGDPEYSNTPDHAENEIRIPISIGEKLLIKVRAISSTGVLGNPSDEKTYSFRGYSDRQYNTYIDIYRMIVPEFREMIQTMSNYIDYIKDANTRIRSMEGQAELNQRSIVSMKDDISQLWERMNELNPIVPLIPIVGDIQDKVISSTTPSDR